MHKRMLVGICCVTMIVLLGSVASLMAATISVVPSGSGKYLVQGGNFSGVAALDVTVKYDAATLSAPQVSQKELASGTLFVANPNLAGQVRLAFVHSSGVSGSGTIAEITFTARGSSAAQPSISAASLYDANGTTIPVTVGGSTVQESSGGPLVQPVSPEPLWTGGRGDSGTKTVSDKGTPATTGTQLWLGTVTMPGDTTQSKEPGKPVVTDTPPPSPPPTTAGSDLEGKSAPPATTPAPARERFTLPAPPASVLERFRTYNGERTVAALKPLFSQRGGAWVTQEPAIALSDGETRLTVQITLDRVGLEAPNFALRGLEMSSLQPVGETGWRIEALPVKGSLQATVSLLVEEAAAELPVTVIPPLPKSWAGKKLTDAEVNRFLAERGTEKVPLGDLNSDGRRDYRDDYIMIGNYLLASSPAKAKDKVKAGAKDAAATPAEQKPAAVPAKNAKDAKPEPGQP